MKVENTIVNYFIVALVESFCGNVVKTENEKPKGIEIYEQEA